MCIEIRIAKDDDAAALAELQRSSIRQALGADYSSEVLECFASFVTVDRFLEPKKPCVRIVGERDGAILGFGTLFLDGTLGGLYVVAAHHAEGIGGRLLEHLEETARHHGLTSLRLESTITAAPFYAHKGYLPRPRVLHALSNTPPISMAVIPMEKSLTC